MADGKRWRTWLAAVRPKPDWLPRASIGLGIGATAAMNVAAGSRGGPGGALIGALIAVGFLVSLETLIFLVRRLARLPWGWAWCLGAGIPLAGLAAITGIVSYLHALTVAEWTGDKDEAGLALTEHLIPLVADLMILTGSVALVALAVAAKRPARPAAEQPESDSRWTASRKRSAVRSSGAVRVRDLVKDLEPARVDELAAMSKRELAAELTRSSGVKVTTWAAETWQRERRGLPSRANGSSKEN